eukprot:GFYU01021074.1.p1 GENE.GFYU01021074.1~~GFYU01021074.1.p1  ORF type:complete len:107 (+),score=5.33 GFYU01021074.1:126-446(+)
MWCWKGIGAPPAKCFIQSISLRICLVHAPPGRRILHAHMHEHASDFQVEPPGGGAGSHNPCPLRPVDKEGDAMRGASIDFVLLTNLNTLKEGGIVAFDAGAFTILY